MLQQKIRKRALTRGVSSHCGLAISIEKYVKAKRRFMEIQIFHHANI
jgi:hypothetical protein